MKANLAIYYYSYPVLVVLVTSLFARVLYLAGKDTTELPGDSCWLRRLLVAGICLVSAGYLALTLFTNNYETTTQLVDMESMKLGFGLMLLGMVFTFDLLVLAVWRREAKIRAARATELR